MPPRAKFPPPVYPRRGKDYIRLRPAPGKVREICLGPSGSPQAQRAYARIVAELSVSQPGAADRLTAAGLLVATLARQHQVWAQGRYEPRQAARVATALEPLVRLYGDLAAAEFGPLALQTVRAEYVRAGYCRRLCNQLTDCVRWMFRRAVSEELVAETVSRALHTVVNIRKGQSVGGIVPPDHARVPAVAEGVVAATLPRLSRIVADMVRLQQLTGARPGEVCVLRPGDLVRPWKTIDGVDMWIYDLGSRHKTDWHGHRRQIPLGPQAQALLRPFLDRDPLAYCFCPAEARREWEAGKRATRKSKVQPSQRQRRKTAPQKQPGLRYSTQSYGKAIAKACLKGQLPHWAPNQIRHAVLEAIEAEHSQEDARCVAGHSTPTTTSVYAQGVLRAAQVLARCG